MMTAAADHRRTASGTGATPYTVERRFIGTPTEVANTVDRVRRSGRLLAMTTPKLMPDAADPRVYVNVRYLAAPIRSQRQVARDRRRAVLRTGCRVAAVAVPVTGVAVALVYAVARLVAELLPYIGGALLVALIVWAAFGRTGVCPGLHCPGGSHGGHR